MSDVLSGTHHSILCLLDVAHLEMPDRMTLFFLADLPEVRILSVPRLPARALLPVSFVLSRSFLEVYPCFILY